MDCLHPLLINGRLVPCQVCPVCRSKVRNDWSFRLRQELGNDFSSAFFVTLTYDPDHLPFQSLKMAENLWSIPNLSNGEVYFYPFRNSHNEESWNFIGGQQYYKGEIIYDPVFGSRREPALSDVAQFQALSPGSQSWVEFSTFEPQFCKKDVDRFIRYLRKVIGTGVRYFLVSEYGGEHHRPHYHCVLFNTRRDVLELREIVDKCWRRGRTQVEYISQGRIHYITKYALKDSEQFGSADRSSPLYPFRRFSTGGTHKKGLGYNYISARSSEFHINDNEHFRLYVNINGDRRLRMPRYFKDRIFDDDMRERISRGCPPLSPLYLRQLRRIGDSRYYEIDSNVEQNIINKMQHYGKDKFIE